MLAVVLLRLHSIYNHCSDTRLRSSSQGDFNRSRITLHLSDKAFCVAGPQAWNSLSTGVRLCVTKTTFCKHLKTHLFRVSYGHIS